MTRLEWRDQAPEKVLPNSMQSAISVGRFGAVKEIPGAGLGAIESLRTTNKRMARHLCAKFVYSCFGFVEVVRGGDGER